MVLYFTEVIEIKVSARGVENLVRLSVSVSIFYRKALLGGRATEVE